MAIMTGRYANRRLREDGYYPVGISIGRPKYPLGYELRDQCYALAPKGNMLKMAYEPYREAYFRKLDEIGAARMIGIVQRLDKAAREEGKTLVLLCFEDLRKADQWCHRTLFAEWWRRHTGELVEELEEMEAFPKLKVTAPPPLEKPMEQIQLF